LVQSDGDVTQSVPVTHWATNTGPKPMEHPMMLQQGAAVVLPPDARVSSAPPGSFPAASSERWPRPPTTAGMAAPALWPSLPERGRAAEGSQAATPTNGGAVSPSAASATPTTVTPTRGGACTPGGNMRSHSPVHMEASQDISEAKPQERWQAAVDAVARAVEAPRSPFEASQLQPSPQLPHWMESPCLPAGAGAGDAERRSRAAVTAVDSQGMWFSVGHPEARPAAARVEPTWQRGRWWLVAPVDLKALEDPRSHPGLWEHAQAVDSVLEELGDADALPELPAPEHWKAGDSCPLS